MMGWKQAASLLFLRVSTGLLCLIWGVLRLIRPDAGARVSGKYYADLFSGMAAQTAWGVALVAIGTLVILGLGRRIVYPLQALVLCSGALAIWRYLLDPLGLWLLDRDSAQLLFFPSLGMAAATLVLLAFMAQDRFALDRMLRR
ncbi:hypothetical protein IM511_06085 [Erythrobacteraceae bacterium E2-1 Yellow Sea]|nr:hypothetical protein [Erythrobacteraceae bacterium E2-1 Yellow Sea]